MLSRPTFGPPSILLSRDISTPDIPVLSPASADPADRPGRGWRPSELGLVMAVRTTPGRNT
jgi:hypothetical protein